MLTKESIKQERLLPGNRILISGNIISVDDQDLSTRQELSDLDKKKADISIEMVNPINWWNKNSKIGFMMQILVNLKKMKVIFRLRL